MKWHLALAFAGLIFVQPAQAAGIPYCAKPLAGDVVEASRDLSYCLKLTTCPQQGALNIQIFGNDQNRLPVRGQGQNYYEGRVGTDQAGDAGKRRLVFLVQGVRGPNATILIRYFSPNHYNSFCELS